MTRSGASGAKARARKVQQATGAKYTRLREDSRGRQYGCRVIQFLTEDRFQLAALELQIAAAWARHGLRVLTLHQYEEPPMDLGQHSRRARVRRAAEELVRTWPGHRSTLLWQPLAGQQGGLLVGQHTPWDLPWNKPRQPSSDETPLQEALALARIHFDVVVLMGSPAWPRTPYVDHFVLLAPLRDGIPVTERRARKAGRTVQALEHPLTPKQSGALLRDRHLAFLAHRPPVAFLGMIGALATRRGQPAPAVEPDFRAALDADMEQAGLPLLGCITLRGTHFHEDSDDPSKILAAPPNHGVDHAATAIRCAW